MTKTSARPVGTTPAPIPHDERMKWFHQAKFGMMIHWGLYSLVGQGTWYMHHSKVPHREYAKLANRFRPRKFDADAWAGLAAETGMKYMVLTTRHHDGFCLYDSKVSEFTSVKRAAKRDFVAEYVDACRRAGLKVGYYYSLLDWRFPGFFEREKYKDSANAMVQQAHDQLRELLTNYGKIDMIWFDGHWFAEKPGSWRWDDPKPINDFWRTGELETMIRSLQPHIVFNDRMGPPGDYFTAEQEVSAITRPNREWEAAQTIGDYWESWCYQRYMPKPSRKTLHQLIIQLMLCAAGGGNLMLNVGPTHDGEIQKEDVKRLKGIGEWIGPNGEAIYGARPLGWPILCPSAQFTQKGTNAYMLMPNWPGPGDTLIASGWGVEPKRASFLETGEPVSFTFGRDGRMIFRNLPKSPPNPYVTTIKIEFDEPIKAREIDDRAAWIAGEAYAGDRSATKSMAPRMA